MSIWDSINRIRELAKDLEHGATLARVLMVDKNGEVKPRLSWEDYLRACERERITPSPLQWAGLLPENENGRPA